MSRKYSSLSPSEGRWMWRLASSSISDLERLWVRDVLETDQDSRRFLLDGFMTRWFGAFGSGSYASKWGGFKNLPTMVLFETGSL